MANFFKQNPDNGLTKLNMAVGETTTVGLYGGGPPPDYNDLFVRSTSGVVKCTENKLVAKRNNRYFTLTATAAGSADIVGTLSEGGTDYCTSSINVAVGSAWGHEKARLGIVTEARKWVATGHYLWGSAGNMPDVPDSIVSGKKVAAQMLDNDDVKAMRTQLTAALNLAKPIVSGLDPATPLIAVAYTVVYGVVYLCAGGISTRPCSVASPKEIDDVVTGMKDIEAPTAGTSLTPRKYGKGAPVMGDNCNNKKHFDCVGLVNYCVGLQLKNQKLVPREIYQWMNAPNSKQADDDTTIVNTAGMAAVMDAKQPCMNGDIVGQYTKAGHWHHIGMIYLDDKTARIVQAVDTPCGLSQGGSYDPNSPGLWTRRVRVLDNLLLDGA